MLRRQARPAREASLAPGLAVAIWTETEAPVDHVAHGDNETAAAHLARSAAGEPQLHAPVQAAVGERMRRLNSPLPLTIWQGDGLSSAAPKGT
jgi:hypothetical protein